MLRVVIRALERDEPAMAEVDQRGGERIAVDRVLAEHRREGRCEPRWRRRQQDRVVDQRHIRVAALLPPGPQEQAEEQGPGAEDGRHEKRIDDRLRAAIRVTAGLRDVVDPGEAGEERAVDIAVPGRRQHRLIDDLLRLVRVEVLLDVPLAGVQVDLAVRRAPLVHVEQDDEAVVDAGSPHPPGVDDGHGIYPGGVERDVVVLARPGHDRELGLSARADRVGHVLRRRHGRGAPDPRKVVDAHAGAGRRERHAPERDRRSHVRRQGNGAEDGGKAGHETARCDGYHGQSR